MAPNAIVITVKVEGRLILTQKEKALIIIMLYINSD